jgi:hypothetical protein
MTSSSDYHRQTNDTDALDSLAYQQLMQPHQSLGLSDSPHLQFYRPLGAQSLSVLDPSIFSAGEASSVQAFLEPFQDSNLFQQAVRVPDRTDRARPDVNSSNTNSASIQRQAEAPETLSIEPFAKEFQAEQPQPETFLDEERSVEVVGDIQPHGRLKDSIAQTKPAPTDEGSSGEFPSHIQPQLESLPTLPIESTESTIGQFVKNDLPSVTNSPAQTILPKSEVSSSSIIPELSASEPKIVAFAESDVQPSNVPVDPVGSEPIESPSLPIQRQSIATTEALPIPSQTTEAINVVPSIDSIEYSSSLIHSQSADKIEVKPASVRLPAIQAQLNETADQANVESSELSIDSTSGSLSTIAQLRPGEPYLIQQPQTIQPQMDELQAFQPQRHESLIASPQINESQTVQLQADSFKPNHLQLDRRDSPVSLAIEPDVPTIETEVPEIQADATNLIVESYDPFVNLVPQFSDSNSEATVPDGTSIAESTDDLSVPSIQSQAIESGSSASAPAIQAKSNSSTIQTPESQDLPVRPTEQHLNNPSIRQLGVADQSTEASIVEAINLPTVTDSPPNIQTKSDFSQSDAVEYDSIDALYSAPVTETNSSSLPDRSLVETQSKSPTFQPSPEALAAEPVTSIDPTQATEIQPQSIQLQDIPVPTSEPNIQAELNSAPVDSAQMLDFTEPLSSEATASAFSSPSLEPQSQEPQSQSQSINSFSESLTSGTTLANTPTQTPQIQPQAIQAPDIVLPNSAPNIEAEFDSASIDSSPIFNFTDAPIPETRLSAAANPSPAPQPQDLSSNISPEGFVAEPVNSNVPTQSPEIQSQQIPPQEHLPQENLDPVIHSQAITTMDFPESNQSAEVVSPSPIASIQPAIEVSETPIAKTEQPTIQKSEISTSEALENTSIPEVTASEPLKHVAAEPDASAIATESIDSSIDPRVPIPQLPTVLQNLTVLQPLNSPTIATKPQNSPQNTSELMLPTDRRSMPHSQNEDVATTLPSNSHWQDTRSDPILNSFVPSSFSSESPAHSQPPSSDWQEPPYSDLHPYEIPQPTIQAKPADIQTEPQAESPESINHSTSDHEAASQSGNPQSSTQNPDNASQSADKLEQLAQAMYRILRQRLALERERSGNSYAGRLSW